jgi:hypothetical protein
MAIAKCSRTGILWMFPDEKQDNVPVREYFD